MCTHFMSFFQTRVLVQTYTNTPILLIEIIKIKYKLQCANDCRKIVRRRRRRGHQKRHIVFSSETKLISWRKNVTSTITHKNKTILTTI